jgi:hypothetical protein
MKTIARISPLLILAALLSASFGTGFAAHHKRAAFYDLSAPVTLKGTIARVDWQNPHATIHVSVSDPAGLAEEWVVEGSALAVLTGRGWTSGSLKQGDAVTVSGFLPATQRTRSVGGATIAWEDGRRLWFGEDLQR